MNGGDEPRTIGHYYLEQGAQNLERGRLFFGIFGDTQQEVWGESFHGAWKLGNHYFHELLSSFVFDFLSLYLLFILS